LSLTAVTIAFGFLISVVGGYARHRVYLAVYGTQLYRPRPDDGAFRRYAELVETEGVPRWPLRLRWLMWAGLIILFAGVLFVR
jgi:hypothetical protein